MKLVLIFNYFKSSSLDKIFIVCFKGNYISKRLVLFFTCFKGSYLSIMSFYFEIFFRYYFFI